MSWQFELRRAELTRLCSGSPLLLAVLKEDLVSYRMLANESQIADHNVTPLHIAASLGANSSFVREILASRADPLRRELESSMAHIREERELALREVLTLKRGREAQRLQAAVQSWFEQEESICFRRAQFKIEVTSFDTRLLHVLDSFVEVLGGCCIAAR